jgi:hypothetical protein
VRSGTPIVAKKVFATYALLGMPDRVSTLLPICTLVSPHIRIPRYLTPLSSVHFPTSNED